MKRNYELHELNECFRLNDEVAKFNSSRISDIRKIHS